MAASIHGCLMGVVFISPWLQRFLILCLPPFACLAEASAPKLAPVLRRVPVQCHVGSDLFCGAIRQHLFCTYPIHVPSSTPCQTSRMSIATRLSLTISPVFATWSTKLWQLLPKIPWICAGSTFPRHLGSI